MQGVYCANGIRDALLLLQAVVQYPLHTLPCSLLLHLRHSPVLQLRCSQSKSIEAKLNFSLAEIDLSDLGGNIAVESMLVHRVRLQCNVDEMGGKYTEAEQRCTCPP